MLRSSDRRAGVVWQEDPSRYPRHMGEFSDGRSHQYQVPCGNGEDRPPPGMAGMRSPGRPTMEDRYTQPPIRPNRHIRGSDRYVVYPSPSPQPQHNAFAGLDPGRPPAYDQGWQRGAVPRQSRGRHEYRDREAVQPSAQHYPSAIARETESYDGDNRTSDSVDLLDLRLQTHKLRRHLMEMKQTARALQQNMPYADRSFDDAVPHPPRAPPQRGVKAPTKRRDAASTPKDCSEPWTEAASHLVSGLGSMVLAVCQLVSCTGKSALSTCTALSQGADAIYNPRAIRPREPLPHNGSERRVSPNYNRHYPRPRSRHHGQFQERPFDGGPRHPGRAEVPSYSGPRHDHSGRWEPPYEPDAPRDTRRTRTTNTALRRMLSPSDPGDYSDAEVEFSEGASSYGYTSICLSDNNAPPYASETASSVVLQEDAAAAPPPRFRDYPYFDGSTSSRDNMIWRNPSRPWARPPDVFYGGVGDVMQEPPAGYPPTFSKEAAREPVRKINLGDLDYTEPPLPRVSPGPDLLPSGYDRLPRSSPLPNAQPSTASQMPEPHPLLRPSVIVARPAECLVEPRSPLRQQEAAPPANEPTGTNVRRLDVATDLPRRTPSPIARRPGVAEAPSTGNLLTPQGGGATVGTVANEVSRPEADDRSAAPSSALRYDPDELPLETNKYAPNPTMTAEERWLQSVRTLAEAEATYQGVLGLSKNAGGSDHTQSAANQADDEHSDGGGDLAEVLRGPPQAAPADLKIVKVGSHTNAEDAVKPDKRCTAFFKKIFNQRKTG
ncbi:hypothetical protein, conserved [Babesia bigemina]|uniref:Uncharacterized protein n=1 Tax=Babesia bigemina TaxID=5866 RepID=A0A061D8K6_BABBI|nr:hypothetical protein, conserved [Babesia bigemina]CDR96848.1 hypothetical protein, conserved [Babesia bigemina]|eukprot:XP_012769034.1 hypothetical protein, conserved [Babesia bigemina]